MLTDSLVEDEVVNSDYNFADGDLSAFQSEFSQPKQDMGISDIPDDLEDEDVEQEQLAEVEDRAAMTRHARQTSKFVTHIVDSGAALGLSLISKNSVDSHKADSDDLKELERIFTEYFKETGGNIPLWAQLLICLTTIYGFQIPQALKDRKLNLERERLELERKKLELEKEEFKRLKEAELQRIKTQQKEDDEQRKSN